MWVCPAGQVARVGGEPEAASSCRPCRGGLCEHLTGGGVGGPDELLQQLLLNLRETRSPLLEVARPSP